MYPTSFRSSIQRQQQQQQQQITQYNDEYRKSSIPSLEDLLRDDTDHGRITLQLGGRDPHTLAVAAAIGAAYPSSGSRDNGAGRTAYSGTNFNCGCPSLSVASGRQTGAALMLEPQHVVQCLNSMTHSMDEMQQQRMKSSSPSSSTKPILSVKHRLGVYDADQYQQRKQQLQSNGQYSLKEEEEEAYQSCHNFVSQLVSSSTSDHCLSRIQVHARLALLGLDNNDIVSTQNKNQQQHVVFQTKSSSTTATTTKVNHQRVQYRVKQQARQATIDNRYIPPLHPHVVTEIARDFSSTRTYNDDFNFDVISNGGIHTMNDVYERSASEEASHVHGAMVGRAAINHPCSFASVDRSLYGVNNDIKTRREVLNQYIQYCQIQEEEFQTRRPSHQNTESYQSDLFDLRKSLVAPAFHLMVGEEGNAEYQRLLKKLVSRSQRHPSDQMLQAAMAQVPSISSEKRLDDHTPWHKIQEEFFETHGESAKSATKRSGAMQRIIH